MLEKSLISSETADFLKENFSRVRDNISRASGGREVTLLAATKTVSPENINYAIDHLGLTDIGENRVQELMTKYDSIHHEKVNVHFIGRLQANKVKYIVDKVCLIHSLDSLGLAAEIEKQASKIQKVMDVLVEVNIGGEASKGGISPVMLESFWDSLAIYPHIRPCGIMVIPPAESGHMEYMQIFRKTYSIYLDICRKKLHNVERPILSMGMSDSYVEAVECGSDLVRIGSALFGKRSYPEKKGNE
jgi:hypothetical protein